MGKIKIAINAGHCVGLDSGAVGKYSTEAEICRDIANIVCQDLYNVGYDVLFIQENELYDICNLSNRWDADVFVSIHCNAAGDPRAHGTECFYYEHSENGRRLAAGIQKQLVNTLYTTDRGIKTNGLYVTKNTDAVACLVECAFISNEFEENLLNNGKNEIAHAIARGITDYFL